MYTKLHEQTANHPYLNRGENTTTDTPGATSKPGKIQKNQTTEITPTTPEAKPEPNPGVYTGAEEWSLYD